MGLRSSASLTQYMMIHDSTKFQYLRTPRPAYTLHTLNSVCMLHAC